ncbi:hypothetical protein BJ508DRAFT_322987 [Ascobolus immersus RN42]|uniref:Uncharacterized protein n=1 Tax=Ascobolus immersus RN42 TaxID=1160509 RepID=A0A3N4IKD8_ASCIM|nr:hypothetical protein BJ508DRAFT_322987 [Ascobolus immersus RN42]
MVQLALPPCDICNRKITRRRPLGKPTILSSGPDPSRQYISIHYSYPTEGTNGFYTVQSASETEEEGLVEAGPFGFQYLWTSKSSPPPVGCGYRAVNYVAVKLGISPILRYCHFGCYVAATIRSSSDDWQARKEFEFLHASLLKESDYFVQTRVCIGDAKRVLRYANGLDLTPVPQQKAIHSAEEIAEQHTETEEASSPYEESSETDEAEGIPGEEPTIVEEPELPQRQVSEDISTSVDDEPGIPATPSIGSTRIKPAVPPKPKLPLAQPAEITRAKPIVPPKPEFLPTHSSVVVPEPEPVELHRSPEPTEHAAAHGDAVLEESIPTTITSEDSEASQEASSTSSPSPAPSSEIPPAFLEVQPQSGLYCHHSICPSSCQLDIPKDATLRAIPVTANITAYVVRHWTKNLEWDAGEYGFYRVSAVNGPRFNRTTASMGLISFYPSERYEYVGCQPPHKRFKFTEVEYLLYLEVDGKNCCFDGYFNDQIRGTDSLRKVYRFLSLSGIKIAAKDAIGNRSLVTASIPVGVIRRFLAEARQLTGSPKEQLWEDLDWLAARSNMPLHSGRTLVV